MPAQHVIDEIHFAVESDQLPSLEEFFLWCDEEGVCSRVAVDFFPHVNSDLALVFGSFKFGEGQYSKTSSLEGRRKLD
jgi:hypothetical protein